MLNKFQEQALMASVEMLEDLRDKISETDYDYSEYSNIIKSFDEIIDTIKKIHPTLFSYPQVAKYITGKFDPTIVEKNDADT